jgi:hypothetical protein
MWFIGKSAAISRFHGCISPAVAATAVHGNHQIAWRWDNVRRDNSRGRFATVRWLTFNPVIAARICRD